MVRRILQRLRSPTLLRFAAVGLSGVFVNLGSLFLLADVLQLDRLVARAGVDLAVLGVADIPSSALAIEISILWNFLLNNAWTFKHKNANARAGFFRRMVSYNVVSLVGLAIQVACFALLSALAMRLLALPEPGLWKYPAQLVGIGVAMGWNFLSNFYFTWAQEKAPEPEAEPEPEDEALSGAEANPLRE